MMARTLIALGSNLGDRTANLRHALDQLDTHDAVHVTARSRAFFTEPIGGPGDQGEFVNAAACLETTLSPGALFQVLREVETQLGRQRRQRWAARVVDLDLLLYEDLVVENTGLEIPHPRMAFRRFVLEPAAQIAPDWVHPVIGWTIRQLLDHLQTAPGYIAVTGIPGMGKTELARAAATRTASRFLADPIADTTSETPRDGSQATALQREKMRLRRRTELVSKATWPAETLTTISDFWIGQGLAYGRARLTPTDCSLLEAEWNVCQDRVVGPKLLVLLDRPLAQSVPPQPQQERAGIEQVQRVLRALFHEKAQGPILELDASRPDWALTELAAAVQAMTPGRPEDGDRREQASVDLT
jgi:2-amino-4-hydroxy-6-hydroxymethyldihydropteridine diphosphokinase